MICQNIDDIRDSFNNEVLLNSNAMVAKMMRESPINPCHITKNIIFLMTGFDRDQMNMVILKWLVICKTSTISSLNVIPRRCFPASCPTPRRAPPP